MRTRRTAALLTLLLATSACSVFGGEDSYEGLTPEPLPAEEIAVAPELERFASQEIDWADCREKFECASVEVPLDYDDPDGRTIELALLRDPANDQERRIGSLLVNPGGPGGSALDYAAGGATYWGRDLREFYDIVGMDPRGVGQSSTLTCVDDASLDVLLASDPSPDTGAERRDVRDLRREFFEGCMLTDPDLATSVGTENVARDLDLVRAMLDGGALTYFGASYGTTIGATYAELFPDNVGRMVLDGATDPSADPGEGLVIQAQGFQTALTAYVENCVDEGGCFLGATVDEGIATIGDLINGLDQNPLPAGDRELTEGLGFYGLIAPLYNREFWTLLDQGLELALAGNGTVLALLSDAYASRNPEGGYLSNAYTMLPVVNCSDDSRTLSPKRIREVRAELADVAPTFAGIFGSGFDLCSLWSFDPDRIPQPVSADGAEPILVVGTTRDPATPLAYAESLADQLSSGVLLIRDGDGHTAYGAGNDCIDDTIESYLVEANVPPDAKEC